MFAMSLDDVIRKRGAEGERVINELRDYAAKLRDRFGRLTVILY